MKKHLAVALAALLSLPALAQSGPSGQPGLPTFGSSGLTVGASPISGICPSGQLLYNNNGVLGCIAAGSAALAIGNTILGGTNGSGLYVSGSTAFGQFTYGGGVFAALAVTAGAAGGFATYSQLGSLALLSSVNNANWSGTGLALSNMATIAANSFLGNNTGSPAVPAALTATQATAALNTFTTTLQGLVPASGGGTTNYLRADGAFAAPSAPTNTIIAGTSGESGFPANSILYSDGSKAQALALGANVFPALGNALNGASGLVGYSGSLGTPTQGVATNLTGLPISTGLSGTGPGVLAALANTAGAAGGFATYSQLGGLALLSNINNANWSGAQLVVGNGGTGLTVGVSGGIPYFSSTSAMASSALLTQYALILGGGAGAAPVSMGSLGTTTTLLHGNAAGAPTYGAVNLATDITGNLPVSSLCSGTGATSATYLRGDCSWVVPPGSGNVSNSGTPTNTQLAQWINSTQIQGLTIGTGVATALGNATGATGGLLTYSGAFGTPTALNLTNATALPLAGLSGLGTNVATALGNTLNALNGLVSYSGSLGTPAQGVLTNATGLPISTGVSGLGASVATILGNAAGAAGGFATYSQLGSLALLSSVNNSNWSGTAQSIGNGGTGQTTASAAFNALSPMTTPGDMIYGGAAGAATRLAGGATTTVMVGGSPPSWGSVPAAALPAATSSTLGGVEPDGTSISNTAGAISVNLANSFSWTGNHSFAGKLKVATRVVSTATVTVSNTSDHTICSTYSGARTVNLPSSPSAGDVYIIKDCAGNAATYNITINPAAGNIDGAPNAVISVNYGSLATIYVNSQWSLN